MKALTLHQPWATLITDGVKTVETRSWRPPQTLIGQRIAIHAGKRLVANHWLNGPIRGAMYRGHAAYWRQQIPRGAVVCTALLSSVGQVLDFEDDGHVLVDDSPSSLVSPNPPKGWRYSSGMGDEWQRGAMVRTGLRVDGSGGGLSAVAWRPCAVCGRWQGEMAGRGRSKRHSRTGVARVCGAVG